MRNSAVSHKDRIYLHGTKYLPGLAGCLIPIHCSGKKSIFCWHPLLCVGSSGAGLRRRRVAAALLQGL